MRKRPFLLFAAILTAVFGSAFSLDAQAATFTVSTTADSGAGSLRQAVNDANAASSDDLILFDSELNGQAIVLANEIQVNNNGTLTISGNGANVLTINGGAGTNRIFYSNAASVIITGMTLTGGNGTGAVGGGDGGAIYANGGALVLDSVHITGNTSAGQGGGAAFVNGTNHQILNSTFSANTAADCGGFSIKGGTLNVTNSTISGNNATGVGSEIQSGGFCSSGETTLRSVTVTGNTAEDVGGIELEGGLLNLGDTIVAGNTSSSASSDIRRSSGILVTAGYNLIGKNESIEAEFPAGNPNVNNDIVGTPSAPINALLDMTLRNNGGTTPTHDLLPGSPAIDKGSAFGTATDQRGLPRPADSLNFPNAPGGSGADIGAFEVQFAPTAAPVSIVGRVLTSNGRALSKVRVSIMNQNGEVRHALTNSFGYYRFESVPAGQTYVISAKFKRFSVNSQTLLVDRNLSNINLIAAED
ncbi:MAG TPA: carboxypeptidase-like regulatory domain-containing protein [Pyrinomonadaceae bacterium]|jgi:hypothetical protein